MCMQPGWSTACICDRPYMRSCVMSALHVYAHGKRECTVQTTYVLVPPFIQPALLRWYAGLSDPTRHNKTKTPSPYPLSPIYLYTHRQAFTHPAFTREAPLFCAALSCHVLIFFAIELCMLSCGVRKKLRRNDG